MQELRKSLLLTRLVLAWFLLTLGVAIASPIVQPRAMQMICAANGSIQVIVLDDSGQAEASPHHTLDCPLCVAITTPPVYPDIQFEQPVPQAIALYALGSQHIAAILGAPFPPRGPPTLM
ncbi:DUF2946 family protein [Ottowia thiooxydans]|uniref:DUF2946 domain-containing protein n=1 Tax=Ottowia thiooxydans TaxID=219182 RepID=A0ABV2Q775_9BURK